MELKEKLEARLAKLKQDFEAGNNDLRNRQDQINQLSASLMRVQGAISVLEEQLSTERTTVSSASTATQEWSSKKALP